MGCIEHTEQGGFLVLANGHMLEQGVGGIAAGGHVLYSLWWSVVPMSQPTLFCWVTKIEKLRYRVRHELEWRQERCRMGTT
jgi:hypothetical protein